MHYRTALTCALSHSPYMCIIAQPLHVHSHNLIVCLSAVVTAIALIRRSWYTGKEQQKRVARSEAQLKYVKLSEENFGAHYWRRFCHVCQAVPVQDNFYLSWWLRGERGFDPQTNPAFAPPYLTENSFTELKVTLLLSCHDHR